MRTLVVFHLGGMGGPQRSLRQVINWLGSQGEVAFLVPERGPTEAEYTAVGPVTVRPYSALTYARGAVEGTKLARRLVREVRMFRSELRSHRPDLVIAVTTVLPALLVAARLERIPSVVYAAELYDQRWKSAPLLRIWGTLLATCTAVLSDGLVYCSEQVARQFPRWARKPASVAYPPIGVEYEGGSRQRARTLYGVERAKPCLVVVGSLSRGRAQDVALRALPLVRERYADARLVIVGAPHPRPVDLGYAAELRALTAALGLEDVVVFADTTDAMGDVYAAADVVVNPARVAESFGRVAAEALMAGRPVVATRVGSLPALIRDGVDGLLVEPDDPESLAAAVERLMDDPMLAAGLVEAGRAHVRERYGYEQDLTAWRSVLEPVLAKRVERVRCG
jgi:glycosyltransferase involved in cell wall biosynthesis